MPLNDAPGEDVGLWCVPPQAADDDSSSSEEEIPEGVNGILASLAKIEATAVISKRHTQ